MVKSKEIIDSADDASTSDSENTKAKEPAKKRGK